MFGFKVMLWTRDSENDTLRNVTVIMQDDSLDGGHWVTFDSHLHDANAVYAVYEVDEIVQITMFPEIEVVEIL